LLKEQSHREESGAKRGSGAKSAEKAQTENNLQKQIVAFQFFHSKKTMQHEHDRKTKQGERRESNSGLEGTKEKCEERSKGGGPGKKAEEETGGAMDWAWYRGMAQNLGVWRGVNLLNMLDLRGGASRRIIVNSGY
jgi:hypothetical protein